jgi:hypothetical protein
MRLTNFLALKPFAITLQGSICQPLNIRIVVTLKQLACVTLLDGGSMNELLLHHRTLLLHGHQAVLRWQGYPMHSRILQEQI